MIHQVIQMTKILFDTNVFNLIENDLGNIQQLTQLQIYMIPTIAEELSNGLNKFQTNPLGWFNYQHNDDPVFILDHSLLDAAKLGDGLVYDDDMNGRTSSKAHKDAIIADAISELQLDMVVTEDKRMKNKKKIGIADIIGYEEFCNRFLP